MAGLTPDELNAPGSRLGTWVNELESKIIRTCLIRDGEKVKVECCVTHLGYSAPKELVGALLNSGKSTEDALCLNE